MQPKVTPWNLSLLIHTLFWAIYIILVSSQPLAYTLRGFWGVLPFPLLALTGSIISLVALKHLKQAPLPRWHKILIQMLHGPGLILMVMSCTGFLILMLGGMISPNQYANHPSPSGHRSITIVSHNITCTQQVYLNHGVIMQRIGSFQIGTAKCLSTARAAIQWQPGETAIAWNYGDRQGIIPLPQ